MARTQRTPTRSDAGSRTKGLPDEESDSKAVDILVKTVPTELVALYTAFIAVVTSLIHAPTIKQPHPNQYLSIRWIAFIALVVLAGFFIVMSYRGKGGKGVPALATVASIVAAAAWGLATPESPLLAAIHDTTESALTAALVAFVGAGLAYGFSLALKTPAKK